MEVNFFMIFFYKFIQLFQMATGDANIPDQFLLKWFLLTNQLFSLSLNKLILSIDSNKVYKYIINWLYFVFSYFKFLILNNYDALEKLKKNKFVMGNIQIKSKSYKIEINLYNLFIY